MSIYEKALFVGLGLLGLGSALGACGPCCVDTTLWEAKTLHTLRKVPVSPRGKPVLFFGFSVVYLVAALILPWFIYGVITEM